MGIKKTTEQYKAELYHIHPNIKLVEEYESANTKVLHHCLTCGHKWKAFPKNLLYYSGCPECDRLSRIKGPKIIRQPIKSQAQQEIDYLIALDKIRPEMTLIGDFNGRRLKAIHLCDNGHFWDIEPSYVLLTGKNFRPCPHCTLSSNVPTYVYYVKITTPELEHFYKIGITHRSVEARFKHEILHGFKFETLHLWLRDTRRLAYELEHELLSYIPKEDFVTDKRLLSGHTESFYTYLSPCIPSDF